MRVLLAFSVVLTLGLACLPGEPPCADDDACPGDNVCTFDPAAKRNVCASPCAADERCKEGTACVTPDESDDDGERAFEGVCLDVVDPREVGQSCTEDRECASGACADDVCVALCDLTEGCADGLQCSLDGLRSVCVSPLDDRGLGASCDSSRECASGVCIVPPAGGGAVCAAPCAGDEDCADGVCLRLELGARACAEVLPDGAACEANLACAGGFCVEDRDGVRKCASACADGGCAPDFFCVSDQDDNDICMPRLDDRSAGETCAVDRECASGICSHFVADTDLGTLCADPCAGGEPVCADGLVCWDGDDVDVCGPTP